MTFFVACKIEKVYMIEKCNIYQAEKMYKIENIDWQKLETIKIWITKFRKWENIETKKRSILEQMIEIKMAYVSKY